jgi:hypothetical protein
MIEVKVIRNGTEESVAYFSTEPLVSKYISLLMEEQEIFTRETIITVERFTGFQHFR